jgi:hypothetical protein
VIEKLEICFFGFFFKFKLYRKAALQQRMKFATGTKPKLLIGKVDEIEQNWTKMFVRFCLLQWHSVNNGRILSKSVNSQYFL